MARYLFSCTGGFQFRSLAFYQHTGIYPALPEAFALFADGLCHLKLDANVDRLLRAGQAFSPEAACDSLAHTATPALDHIKFAMMSTNDLFSKRSSASGTTTLSTRPTPTAPAFFRWADQ